jgi:putative salt-induced outer membrane protein YdiY
VAANVIVLLGASASGLFAQQAGPPPPVREGKAEFALVATSGNSSTQSIGAAGEVTYRPPAWVLNGKAIFVRNEANNLVSARSFATLGRAARVLTPRLQAFGQHQYLRDLFSGIAHRNSLDGGLSFLVVGTSRHTLFADGGIGYLRERRLLAADLSTPTGSGGLRYKLVFSPTADFTDDLLTTMDFAEEGTWRLAQAAAFTARLAAAFSLKVSNQIRFVNVPVPGFERTDTITSTALVVSF